MQWALLKAYGILEEALEVRTAMNILSWMSFSLKLLLQVML